MNYEVRHVSRLRPGDVLYSAVMDVVVKEAEHSEAFSCIVMETGEKRTWRDWECDYVLVACPHRRFYERR